ncbi:MAG: STAS domain-containing protein [Sphaerospermopsis sp. SIO1G1]|nr:STAS domain-containing protein [Sphaerospermopsis sp. SIO1G1]
MSQHVKVIKLNENLNAETSPKFQQEVAQILGSDVETVLVDCQNITFLDSSGLGSLVLAFKTLRNANIEMVLCSVKEEVKMIFELTSMSEIIDIFPNENAFHEGALATN